MILKDTPLHLAGTLCATLLLTTSPLFGDGVGHHHDDVGVATQSSASWPVKRETASWPYQSRVIKAGENTLGQPAVFGQWSDVMSWPVIAVHANLLPNGKVLAWDATPDDFDDDPHTAETFTTRVTLWDPQDNSHVSTNNDTNSDLFCAGSAHMWDGRILFAGGDTGRAGLNGPLSNTSIYDHVTNTWRQVANMAAPRWYSSLAALPNGELLTYGGTYTPVPVAEVFTFEETWRSLIFDPPEWASIDYQWLQATPEGKVMSFGPQRSLATIDTEANGSVTLGAYRDEFSERRYGSYAMYDIGKVLVAGGANSNGLEPSYKSSVVIDTATGQSTDTGSLGIGRTQHNLTILADGSVLATGGADDGPVLVSMDGAVFRPEIWSPETGQWRYMNDMQINRQYHSIALLLADGRVLSAGGGYCGTCAEVGYEEKNAEIFSPPYLFSDGDTLAVRPQITSGPSVLDYDRAYSFTTDQAPGISKVHLIKPGAVTHSQNQDQRLIPLQYTSNAGSVTVASPENRNIAPPGHYLLFLVNDEGVPSVGKMIKVGQPLVASGDIVSNAVRAGETDSYAIESSDQDAALLVSMTNVAPGTRLSVVGDASTGQVTAECNAAAVAQTVECRLSNQVATRWLLNVSTDTTTDYVLVPQLSTVDDPAAEQPNNNPEPPVNPLPVVTGGGAWGLGLPGLFAALLIASRRRFCSVA